MPYQIWHINNIGIIKRNEIEILALKSSIAKMESSPEGDNSGTCTM